MNVKATLVLMLALGSTAVAAETVPRKQASILRSA